jgi:hypothetical protein
MLYIVFDCGIIFREIEAQQIEVGRAEAQARLYLFNNPEPESDLSLLKKRLGSIKRKDGKDKLPCVGDETRDRYT